MGNGIPDFAKGSIGFVAGLALLVGSGLAGVAVAAENVRVDWGSELVTKFLQDQGASRSARASAAIHPNIRDLQLPVLGFERPPGSVVRSLGVRRASRPLMIMDKDNPVWYELTYDYGDDIKVTVSADLRVQHELPADTKLFQGPPGSQIAEDEAISVFDERSEVGMEGAIAEFQVRRFGEVTYTVTVECGEARKSLCKDVEALKKDKQLLAIISANPPATQR